MPHSAPAAGFYQNGLWRWGRIFKSNQSRIVQNTQPILVGYKVNHNLRLTNIFKSSIQPGWWSLPTLLMPFPWNDVLVCISPTSVSHPKIIPSSCNRYSELGQRIHVKLVNHKPLLIQIQNWDRKSLPFLSGIGRWIWGSQNAHFTGYLSKTVIYGIRRWFVFGIPNEVNQRGGWIPRPRS